MTCVYGDYAEGQPGVHALIVGVSAYRHLPGGKGDPMPDPYGMVQLKSAAQSAYLIYRWLMSNKDSLPQTLRSVRLLLSPAPGDQFDLPAPVAPCIRENFKKEAKAWRNDAASHRDNVMLFYFAGHGIQIDTNLSTNMLMEDFGEDSESLLGKGVSVGNLFDLMRPVNARKEIARTQLYLIDCCRLSSTDFQRLQNPKPSDLWDVENSEGIHDDRKAPVIFSALPGAPAFERPDGSQTFFAGALLECLKSRAADKIKDKVTGQQHWDVNVFQLVRILNVLLDRAKIIEYARAAGVPIAIPQDYNQPVRMSGIVDEVRICRLATVPQVKVKLSVTPVEALQHTKVTAKTPTMLERNDIPYPLPSPYEKDWEVGYYFLAAEVTAPDLDYRSCGPEFCEIEPQGDFAWEARMQ